MKKVYIILDTVPEKLTADEFSGCMVLDPCISYAIAEQELRKKIDLEETFYICELRVVSIVKSVEKIEFEVTHIPNDSTK